MGGEHRGKWAQLVDGAGIDDRIRIVVAEPEKIELLGRWALHSATRG